MRPSQDNAKLYCARHDFITIVPVGSGAAVVVLRRIGVFDYLVMGRVSSDC
jgi:hypothetical protein